MTYESEPGDVQELALSTAKKSVIYVGGEIATSVVTFIMIIVLARLLQPAAFGLYSIAIAFNMILGIASNFGIGNAFRKMIPEFGSSKQKINELLGNGYFVATTLGLVIAIAGIIASGYIATNMYGNSTLALPLEIASLAEFFTVLFNLTQGALVGLGMVKEATYANGVYSFAYLFVSIALVLLGYGVTGAVTGLLLGLVLGSIVGFTYTIAKTGFSMIKPAKDYIKKLMNFSVPVMVSYVATQGAQNLAVLILGVYAASVVVGNYGAAFKIAQFVVIIMSSMSFILLGTFAQALAKKVTAVKIGEIYNSSVYYTALFLFPLIAYTVAVAQPITNLLFSAQYTTAPLYFVMIAIGTALSIIALYAGTLVISKGDTKKFMRYQVSAVIVQIVLLLVLTPLYQVAGVLLALYLITPIFLNILYMRALEEQFRFKQEFERLAKVTVVSVIIGILLYAVAYLMHQSKWSIIIDAIIALLLFPPLAALTRSVDEASLEFIKKAGARLRQLHVIVDWIVGYTQMFVK